MIDLLYILAFTVFFSFFDYIGYNVSVKKGWVNDKFINPYRIVQGGMQIVLLGTAFYFFGWVVSLGFFLLWISWCCDWLYYIFDYLAEKIFKTSFEGGIGFKNVKDNGCNWAWWTLYGLYDLRKRGKENGKYRVIKGSTLLWQSWIGILITILIVLWI